VPSIVHCEDSRNAASERDRSYDPHIQYLGTLKDRIRFAGPLATADGARGRGDEKLVGSLFVLDVSPSVALELMRSDPYLKSGVWQHISVFQAVASYGPWPSGVSVKPQGRIYATLASSAAPPLVATASVLFGAQLETRTGRLEQMGASTWRALAIFSATSLEDARSLLVEPAANGTTPVTCWSIPITVGTWTIPPQTP
jgi:uncharacterized protein YciI